jgi:hypothetical protein
MDETSMGAVRRPEVRSRNSFSGLLISKHANSTACRCASERRLQRPGTERAVSQPFVPMHFFLAQRLCATKALQSFGESPLHPATHPSVEAPNTSTSSPAVVVLLRTFFRTLSTQTVSSLWPGP